MGDHFKERVSSFREFFRSINFAMFIEGIMGIIFLSVSMFARGDVLNIPYFIGIGLIFVFLVYVLFLILKEVTAPHGPKGIYYSHVSWYFFSCLTVGVALSFVILNSIK